MSNCENKYDIPSLSIELSDNFKYYFNSIYLIYLKYLDNVNIDIPKLILELKFDDYLNNLFNHNIFKHIKQCSIAYIESMIVLFLENKRITIEKVLNKGSFNVVFEIKMTYLNKTDKYALRLSNNEASLINCKNILEHDYYDNMLYYNDIMLKKYLKYYPNVIDSSNYIHKISNNTKYYTHWSISKIYKPILNINDYKMKYIHMVNHLLKIFIKNSIMYYDWKLNNFMIDDNDNLILVDIDFENPYDKMSICSTHLLTPEPTYNQKILSENYSTDKYILSCIYMYMSAYLSIISVYCVDNITDYYRTFRQIHKFYNNIDSKNTISSLIKIVSNNKYSNIPDKLSDKKQIIKMFQNSINKLDVV